MLALMTGFFLASYFAALAGAYRRGDISLAYPLARSSPVIVVAFVTVVLGKGHEVGWWCNIGIVLVVAGCFMVPMKDFSDFHLQNYLNVCCLMAFIAALGTSGYTIVDDEALRRLRGLPGTPFEPVDATVMYLVLEGVSCCLWLGVFVLLSTKERRNFSDILRFSKGPTALTGIGMYVTYGLVLASMAYVRNVSYVAAFRQLSIPLGAILGMCALKEPRYLPKVIGVATIFVGLVLVGTG
jgi:drug/metabolite transporter (DMT)-like permease